MKKVILLGIKIYWSLVPAHKRRTCIFRESCSRHVYRELNASGLIKGVAALRFRVANCRHGFHLFDDPVTKKRVMLLPGGQQVAADEIAERLLII